jgi:hypothetical protein
MAITNNCRAGITCALLSAAQLMGYAASVNGNERLREIIDNVRTNEALYQNIEVRMVDQYRIIDRKPSVNKIGEGVGHEKGTIDKDVRYVAQNGMFRVEVEGECTTSGPTLSEDRIAMFDGESTRLLDQKKVGNIIVGRRNDVNAVRPHMLLLHDSFPVVALSVYLQGHAAMLAVPDAGWDPAFTQEVTYQGEADFQALKCHKVALTTRVPHDGAKAESSRVELWLAEDRNYIPVRLMVYNLGWSRELACTEGSVSAFREVREGVWFPAEASVLRYADAALHYKKRQEPYGRYTYHVKDVSLNPKYDVAFFRDLTFPPGTAVYEMQNDKILKSYTIGQAGDPALAPRRWLWWILGLNVALVVAIVGAIYLRRRKRRQAVA